MDTIFENQTKRGRDRAAEGVRTSQIDGSKQIQILTETLLDSQYDFGFENQQAADFHLKWCADLGCNLLMQFTSTEMGVKAVDLLIASARRLTVRIPLRDMMHVLLSKETETQPRMKRRLRHGIRSLLDAHPAESTVWLAVHAKRYGSGTRKDTSL